MNMYVGKIGSDGTPEAIYTFPGEGLGRSPGWGMMHGMGDGVHLALATSVSKNLTIPGHTKIVNSAISGSSKRAPPLRARCDPAPPLRARCDPPNDCLPCPRPRACHPVALFAKLFWSASPKMSVLVCRTRSQPGSWSR